MIWRNLIVLTLGGVVVWDFLTADPGQSAFIRATSQFVERVRQEMATVEYERVAREILEKLAERIEPAPQAPTVDRTGDDTPDGLSARLASLDSVFSKEAVTLFIDEAARRTGIAQSYLMHLAERESSFNPVAEAGTSSAAGLYQFLEQTWLFIYAKYGAQHGQEELSRLIHTDRSGRLYVTDQRSLKRILDLRFDPKLSTFLAAHFTRENIALLTNQLHRQVSYADLYIAHFLGAGGAIKLINARENSPNVSAVKLFPAAARANRSFFYDRRGKPVSVKTLYESLLALCDDLVSEFASI